jgi:hypothetical protein
MRSEIIIGDGVKERKSAIGTVLIWFILFLVIVAKAKIDNKVLYLGAVLEEGREAETVVFGRPLALLPRRRIS